ncbi:MAG: hypothetical protein AAB645_01880 [Patescibacteria group bacterium]
MPNHDQNHNRFSMLWIMLPCLLLIILVASGLEKFTGGWIIWILLAVCFGSHFLFMGRGRHSNGHDDSNPDDETAPSESGHKQNIASNDIKKPPHSCCH